MHVYSVFLTVIFLDAGFAKTTEVGKEVEGGVELMTTGPIQLILPDILSFTIKNTAHCKGLFRICYLSDPKANRDILMDKYNNVGGSCPPGGYCTVSLEPEHDGVFALVAEDHDGNWVLIIIVISIGLCICIRHKRKACPNRPLMHDQQSLKSSIRSGSFRKTPPLKSPNKDTTTPSPKALTSNVNQFGESKIQQSWQKPTIHLINLSNSVASNDDV
uniref:Ovule protein n=1 Tax=Panagrellus redivivus TaxID=6233 RepID=A0A7E4UWH8_PANRE